MSGAGSGACELTNHSRLGGGLKRQELKQGISESGGRQKCSTGQYEKPDVFFSIKSFKLTQASDP